MGCLVQFQNGVRLLQRGSNALQRGLSESVHPTRQPGEKHRATLVSCGIYHFSSTTLHFWLLVDIAACDPDV